VHAINPAILSRVGASHKSRFLTANDQGVAADRGMSTMTAALDGSWTLATRHHRPPSICTLKPAVGSLGVDDVGTRRVLSRNVEQTSTV